MTEFDAYTEWNLISRVLFVRDHLARTRGLSEQDLIDLMTSCRVISGWGERENARFIAETLEVIDAYQKGEDIDGGEVIEVVI